MKSAKVFGIGLSRTGTTSLTEALRILGYKSLHYPISILRLECNELRVRKERVEEYDAFTDMPVSATYKELDQLFPGSKFILTVRDTESWYKSMQRLKFTFFLHRQLKKTSAVFLTLFGTYSLNDKETLCSRYKQFNSDAQEYFKDRRGDLLVLDLGSEDKWEQLAEFLGGPTPSNTPYPRRNIKKAGGTMGNAFDWLRQVKYIFDF